MLENDGVSNAGAEAGCGTAAACATFKSELSLVAATFRLHGWRGVVEAAAIGHRTCSGPGLKGADNARQTLRIFYGDH